MKIDKNLNMVIPVECDDGSTVYAHAAPVSKETFDQNFWVMSRALTAIYTAGLGQYAGPRVAAKILVDIGDQMGRGDSAQAVLAESRRLTNVVVMHEGRWTPMPFADAIARNIIDARDADEVENAVAFFILVSAVHRRRDAEAMMKAASGLWSAQLTSSNSTAYASSLPTLTPPAPTGVRAPASSIPS